MLMSPTTLQVICMYVCECLYVTALGRGHQYFQNRVPGRCSQRSLICRRLNDVTVTMITVISGVVLLFILSSVIRLASREGERLFPQIVRKSNFKKAFCYNT